MVGIQMTNIKNQFKSATFDARKSIYQLRLKEKMTGIWNSGLSWDCGCPCNGPWQRSV